MKNIIIAAENYANDVISKFDNLDEQTKDIVRMEIVNAFVKGSENIVDETLDDSIEFDEPDVLEDSLDEEGETNYDASADDTEDFEPMDLSDAI